MSPKEMIPLLPSHTHLLHRQLQIVFLRCVCWMPGAPRQRSWQQASHVAGKEESSSSLRVKKMFIPGTTKQGREPVAYGNLPFSFLPTTPPHPGAGPSKLQTKTIQFWQQTHRQRDFFPIFPRLYDKRGYLLSKYDFCHISLRAFLCTHTWKQIASFISAKLQWLLPVIEAL